MFDVAPIEFLAVALVALIVIGPKDLPKAMRVVGHWVGRARAMASHFRSGIDTMMREAELEEMEKKWAADNERTMREHPAQSEDEASSPETPAANRPDLDAAPPAPTESPTLFDPNDMPLAPSDKPARKPRKKKAAP